MKTPEETKNLLAAWGTGVLFECGDETHRPPGIWQGTATEVCRDAINLIQQLETNYSQVSKALCGKENATLEDVLGAVDQLKNDLQYTTDAANIMKDEALKLESRLSQAERELDAAKHFIQKESFPSIIWCVPEACRWCKNHDGNFTKDVCKFCSVNELNGNWEWRGVCEENIHDQPIL